MQGEGKCERANFFQLLKRSVGKGHILAVFQNLSSNGGEYCILAQFSKIEINNWPSAVYIFNILIKELDTPFWEVKNTFLGRRKTFFERAKA